PNRTRMSTSVASKPSVSEADSTDEAGHSNHQGEALRHAIEHAAHLLPAQGPITVFIHHNTLHAFEDLPFFEAVERGARVFGCQPYLSEERFRDALHKGRIRFSDLRTVLRDDLRPRAAEDVAGLCTRFDLRFAMLQFSLRTGPDEEIEWFLAE